MPPSAKNGNLELRDIALPRDSPSVGQPFDISWKVANGALFIEFDPDECTGNNPCDTPGFLDGYGFCVTPCVRVVETNQVFEASSHCIGTTEIGSVVEWYTETFPGFSQPGMYTLEFFIKLKGSGQETGRMTRQISITDDGKDREESDPGDTDPGSDDGTDGLTTWALRNPVKAGAIGIGTAIAINQVIK
jgi:hypothetical protein